MIFDRMTSEWGAIAASVRADAGARLNSLLEQDISPDVAIGAAFAVLAVGWLLRRRRS